jgi:hypothetical protein
MKRINPKDDFGREFFDVGDENLVKLIVSKLDIERNKEIELSFQGCITNYPATSKIIDSILYQLSELEGQKELVISVSLDDDPIHLLNGLFFGSRFLKIQEDSELLSLIKMNKTIKEMIEDKGIKISIHYVDISGKIRKIYYGN